MGGLSCGATKTSGEGAIGIGGEIFSTLCLAYMCKTCHTFQAESRVKQMNSNPGR